MKRKIVIEIEGCGKYCPLFHYTSFYGNVDITLPQGNCKHPLIKHSAIRREDFINIDFYKWKGQFPRQCPVT